MTIHGNSSEQILPAQTEGSDEWLALDHAPKGSIVAWSESHAGLILLAANVVLWGAVGCGVHFG